MGFGEGGRPSGAFRFGGEKTPDRLYYLEVPFNQGAVALLIGRQYSPKSHPI